MFISQYSPDVIARNVKQLGDGVIEVRRYNDGHVRADLSWVWFLCTIGFLVYDYLTSQTIINDMKWAISVDWGIEDTWNQHLSFSWYDKSPPPGYYDEFKARMVKKHWASFYRGWFYILFPLFWFFMVASPKWRPVRFDAKRRLVYFC
ncbi:hypothetical protein D18P1_0303695, partial [Aggregatibacter actinomycetemcomitans serotype f str. D18P1]